MTLQKLHKVLVSCGITAFLLFSLGSGFLVFASSESALQQKNSQLDTVTQEWQRYQDQIDAKYSDQIERNRQRLYELELQLEHNLQNFQGRRQETEATEKALRILQSKLNTLRGNLDYLALQIENTGKKITSISEQISIKESRLAQVMAEKQVITAEANVQKDIVLSYFSLLQTDGSSFDPTDFESLKILFSGDSFSKSLRDEMHFSALEKTARQLFHDFEGAKAQLEEVDSILSRERTDLKNLQGELFEEKNTLLEQKKGQEELFTLTRGEEEKFQKLLDESRAQMEQSAESVGDLKNDMAYIQEQLSRFETQKNLEKEDLSKDRVQDILEGTADPYEVGKQFVIDDATQKPFAWPVPPKKIMAYFHDQSYEDVFHMQHNAIDIRATQGTVIKAPAAAYVYKVADNGMGYSYLTLVHKNNLVTVYGHVSKFLVKKGDLVQAGDDIALTGGTLGTPGAGVQTTGPHLHFEVWEDGVAKNPLDYLPLEAMNPEDIPPEYLGILPKKDANKEETEENVE